MVRDAVLTVSGLLSRKIGGPSASRRARRIWDIPIQQRAMDSERRGGSVPRGSTVIRRSATYPSFHDVRCHEP